MRTGGRKLPWGPATAAVAVVVLSAAGGCSAPGENYAEVTTPADFAQQLAARDKPVFVVFHRTWCLNCMFLSPTFASLSEQYAGRLHFVGVDGADGAVVRRGQAIRYYPTAILYIAGRERHRWVNELSRQAYCTVLDAVLAEKPTASAARR